MYYYSVSLVDDAVGLQGTHTASGIPTLVVPT